MRLRIRSARVDIVATPLRRPFVTALGRRTHTVNVGLSVRLSGGAVGYGEASTSLAMKHLTASALAKTLRALSRRAIGADAGAWRELTDDAWRRAGDMSPAVAAFECALLSAVAADGGHSLSTWFGAARGCLETDVTISAWDDPQFTRAAAAEAARGGFRTLKVKLGSDFRLNVERVRAVRQGAPRARILLDGNQGLTPREALRLFEALHRDGADIILFEQPVDKNDLPGMAFVAKRLPIPVAADESVATPQKAAEVLGRGAATAVNIKAAKSGLSRSLEIAAIARAAACPLMIGCMAESSRGLSASVHLALGTGFFRFIDLDSDVLLRETAAAKRGCGWTRRGRFVSAA